MSEIEHYVMSLITEWMSPLAPPADAAIKLVEFLRCNGYAIVPLEPTKEMLDAVHPRGKGSRELTTNVYKAMILNQDPKPR